MSGAPVSRTIFDDIVDGIAPSWKVWEDDAYVAFLTPFPSTPGLTIVIPKKNPGDYMFDLNIKEAHSLIDAATKVAKILEKAFGVSKVAMVFEGEGVPHVHAKLYPLHGLENGVPHVTYTTFYPQYPGFINTGNGPRLSDQELTDLQEKIRKAADNEN